MVFRSAARLTLPPAHYEKAILIYRVFQKELYKFESL
jgi:hypothetical protein